MGARARGRWVVAIGWIAVGALSGEAAAQSLEQRIRSAPPGDVAFEAEVRDGVRICGDGDIARASGVWLRRSNRPGDGYEECPEGPLRVVLGRAGDGRLIDVELERARPGFRGTEVGVVDPLQAGDFLIARASATELGVRGARNAIMAATLIRGYDAAPGLLEIARDRAVPEETRRSALFWVAQTASERIGTHLVGIAADEAEDQEVRDAAVFALSRRPDAEAVPALMELARTAPHAGTRRSALFWLAGFDDPRVPDFFADLILRGG